MVSESGTRAESDLRGSIRGVRPRGATPVPREAVQNGPATWHGCTIPASLQDVRPSAARVRAARARVGPPSSPRSEETERARVSVQERRPLHGPDLAVAEEPADRQLPEPAARGVGVVVCAAEEMLAAPEARKQQGARGG